MNSDLEGRRGVITYSLVVLAGAAAVTLVMRVLDLTTEDAGAVPLILIVMWVPACARLIAMRGFDHKWHAPFPLRRWSSPAAISLLVPLGIVCAIYATAYLVAMAWGVPRGAPRWQGARAIANVVVNLVFISTIGLLGALGEELGWRGYLQPRLDALRVRGSLAWVIVIETVYHLPLILFGGYLAGASPVLTVVLFVGLGSGLVPLWTWATYRWRTIWMAVWFHAFHNGLSQVLFPNLFGAGSALILGESGILPVLGYVLSTAIVFGGMRARRQRWADLAQDALKQTSTGMRTERRPQPVA